MTAQSTLVTILLPNFEASPEDASGALVSSFEQRVLYHLGYETPESGALPSVLCHHQQDFGAPAEPGSVAAVPVHIAMDSEHGRLVPAEALELSLDECAAICTLLNDFLKSDGTCFKYASAERWYLLGCNPDDIAHLDTLPAHALAQRNLGHFLPRQKEAASWRRLSTEIQMSLHEHPVNTDRQRRGLLPISSFGFGVAPLCRLCKARQ